jgi:DNA helicase-2/ATP-dependent DNA helicase PcrA
MPEASIASRFLEEIPSHLIQEAPGSTRQTSSWNSYGSSQYGRRTEDDSVGRHYSYEDEDQSAVPHLSAGARSAPLVRGNKPANSLDNIAQFFSSRGAALPKSRPKLDIPEPTGSKGLKSGQRVRHPKYGEGVVFRREGDGEDAKVTVQFSKFGVKKLVEKFAQLERL